MNELKMPKDIDVGEQHHIHLRLPKWLWKKYREVYPEHGEATSVLRYLAWKHMEDVKDGHKD